MMRACAESVLTLWRRRRWPSVMVLVAVCCALIVGVDHARPRPVVPFTATGGFSVGGEYPSANAGDVPGTRWASWSGSDGNTGRLMSAPFDAPSALVMAVDGYPSRDVERIELERLQTRERIRLAVPDSPEAWTYRFVAIPPAWRGRTVRLVVTDEGTGPRDWVGVANVHAARRDEILLGRPTSLRGYLIFLCVVLLASAAGVGLNRLPRRSAGPAPLAKIPALVAALGMFPLLALVLRRAVDVPYWDEWEWTGLVYAAHTHQLTFAAVWEPHAEHRIFIPNLIMLGLDLVGGWNVVREQLVSLIVLALTQLVAWALIRRTVAPAWAGWCFLAATVLLLSLSQYENLSWGFQMAWFICDLGLVVAVWALTSLHRTSRDVVVALIAATVASLSSSQGLLVWAAGFTAIVCVPRRRLQVGAVWTVVGAVVALVVRPGGNGTSFGHVGASHVGLLAHYALIYLGTPLAGSFGPETCVLAGIGFVLAACGLAAVVLRAPLGLRMRLVPWAAMVVYPLLAAVVTASGRAGLGLEQALASRYTSISALGWIALIAAAFIAVPRGRRPIAFAVLPVAAVLAASLVQSASGNQFWHARTDLLQTARRDFEQADPAALRLVYPDPGRAAAFVRELAEIKDGIFAGHRP